MSSGGRVKHQSDLFPTFLRHWLVSRALVAVLALVCYANSCWGDFVFDDSEAILGNEDVETGVADIFSHDFWGSNISSKTSHKSYRPLTVLTFRLSYWFAGGRNPFHFHLANVLLHPVICLLVLEVANRWLNAFSRGNKPSHVPRQVHTTSLVAALLFGVHPIHTESVSSVVGRAELNSALCFMTALLVHTCHCLQDRKRQRISTSLLYTMLVLLLAACAMLCKEQGITVLGVCVVCEFVYVKVLQSELDSDSTVKGRERRREQVWGGSRLVVYVRVALLCAGGVALLWGRFAIMSTGAPKFQPSDNPAAFSESWTTRTLSYNYVYAINVWLLLHPWWFCFDWSMGCLPLLSSPTDPRTLAIISLWAGLTTLTAWSLWRLLKKGEGRIVVLSLSLLVLPFLPASNLLFKVGFVVAERVLYLSSAGHCMLVAIGTTTIAAHSALMRRFVQAFMVYLVAAHSLRSIHRSSQWLNEETLFTSGLHVCPLNAKVHYNVGKILSDDGLADKAEAAYKEAIRLHPEYDQALNNIANLVKDSGRLLEAEMYLERAIHSNSEFAAAWMNLAIVQAALNKTEMSEGSYRMAITHRKKYPDAYYNMGNLYIDSGRSSDAIAAFRMAIDQQPQHSNAWSNLGLLYEDLGMYKEAESVWREAMNLMPDNAHFYSSLGVLLGRTRRLEEGEVYLLQAIELRSDVAKYHSNLGVIYHMLKRYDLAEKCYSTALQLEPTSVYAKDNMKKLHSVLSKHP